MASGMRKLAEATGLSIATVSRALNNSDAVTPKTRAIVVDAARRLGYAPSAAARALATRRTRTVGAVIPTLAHSIFSTFIGAIEETLAGLDYGLVIATSGGDCDVEARRAIDLMNLGAEGLIVSGTTHAESLLDAARTRSVPLLCTSTFDPASSLPTIGYDNHELGGAAVRFLLERGHQDLLVLHGPSASNDRTRLRLDGIRSVAADRARLTLVESELSVSDSAEAATAYLTGTAGAPATAALCLSDVLAMGLLFSARRLDIRVPQQMSVMGFDNLEWANSAEPALTTIALPVVDMGERSAHAIAAALDDAKPIVSQKPRW